MNNTTRPSPSKLCSGRLTHRKIATERISLGENPMMVVRHANSQLISSSTMAKTYETQSQIVRYNEAADNWLNPKTFPYNMVVQLFRTKKTESRYRAPSYSVMRRPPNILTSVWKLHSLVWSWVPGLPLTIHRVATYLFGPSVYACTSLLRDHL